MSEGGSQGLHGDEPLSLSDSKSAILGDRPPPIGQRVRDTFLAPGRLASRIRGTAPWMDVLLISTGVAILAVLGIPDDVFLEPMQDAVTRRGEPVEITSSPDEVARWGRAMAMLGTLATHPVIAFVIAGVLTAVFAIVGGGRGGFREYLSLASHALLIPALGTVLTLVVRLSMGPDFPLSWGSLLDPPDGDSTLITTALAGIDPFVLWMLVVLGLGTSRLDGKRGPIGATLLLLVLYGAVLLASAALIRGGVT